MEALWAGRGAYLEAGAEGGGKCGYLPPHILNPAASPRLPYTAPGTPSQAMEGREVTSEGDHPPQTKGWGALGPTLESGRVCLVLVLAASLIKFASRRMVSGGEGGGSPLTLHLGSQTCQAGCSFFLQQRRGMGKGSPSSWTWGQKAAQKGWDVPLNWLLCPSPQGIQSHHVCDQQEDGTIPGSGDPQPPGPCQQGRRCWDCRNLFFFYINTGAGGWDGE